MIATLIVLAVGNGVSAFTAISSPLLRSVAAMPMTPWKAWTASRISEGVMGAHSRLATSYPLDRQRLTAPGALSLHPLFLVLECEKFAIPRGFHAPRQSRDRRVQVLLRQTGAGLQGRRDGHRRAERLREEQHLRRDLLGAGRAEREEPARVLDGGRDLRGQPVAPAPGHGRGQPQGLGPERQQPRRQPRLRGDPPALPERRERVPDERPR